MSTAYTDEEIYLRYRPHALSDAAAVTMVAEHRARFPPDTVDMGAGVWAGMTSSERRTAVLYAIRRASLLSAGAERTAWIAHALRGALAGV
jgi:hypothetical protein